MLAIRLWGKNDLRLENVSYPGALKNNEVLLKISSVGICGSDLLKYKGRPDKLNFSSPIILGHEFSAVVQEIGSSASLDGNFNKLKIGTRVAVDPNISCNKCEYCLLGNPNLCIYPNKTGIDLNGALCEYLIVDSRMCFPLDDLIDDAMGTLIEPLSVAIHNVHLGKVSVGKNIAILGAGPIGLCIMLVCKAAGADKIFMTDRFQWRLDLAKKLGAETINVLTENPVAAIKNFTNNRGVDVVFEAAWVSETAQQSVEIATNGGKVVLVGIPDKNDELNIKHSLARSKGLTIYFSKRTRYSFSIATQIMLKNLEDMKSIISHEFPLKDTARAFEINANYEDNVIKTVINVK